MIILSDCKLALFVAFKTISKGSASTSFLLIFILGLVFFNLLFVTGFLAGFSDGVVKSMVDSTTSHVIITPEESPVRKTVIINQDTLRRQVETIPGVLSTSRHYLLSGSIAYDKEGNGSFKYMSAPIVGIGEVDEKKTMSIARNMVSGDFPDNLRDDEIILGANIAGGYDTVQATDLGGVKAGEKVHVVYANGVNKIYTVRGVFKVTLGFSSNNAYISDKEAERILLKHNEASEIMIRVDLKKHSVEEYAEKVSFMAPNLKVQTYKKRMAETGDFVNAFDAIALTVRIISIVVSAATVFVMVYINAISKQKQIGILKAIGIKERIIEWSYVAQSLFYACLGSVAGSLFLFFVAIPFLKIHPIAMPFGSAYLVLTAKEYIHSVMYMIIISAVAGYLPARIVSRRDILKVVWG